MTKCPIDEHIFSLNANAKLACEKCELVYNPDYLADVETHKNTYRSKLWKMNSNSQS
jgi:hypothetical protein